MGAVSGVAANALDTIHSYAGAVGQFTDTVQIANDAAFAAALAAALGASGTLLALLLAASVNTWHQELKSRVHRQSQQKMHLPP